MSYGAATKRCTVIGRQFTLGIDATADLPGNNGIPCTEMAVNGQDGSCDA